MRRARGPVTARSLVARMELSERTIYRYIAALQSLREAIRGEAELRLSYHALGGERTERDVKPLLLTYYVEVAMLRGWCALRRDFRAFRLDRITTAQPTGVHFKGEGAALRAALEAAEA